MAEFHSCKPRIVRAVSERAPRTKDPPPFASAANRKFASATDADSARTVATDLNRDREISPRRPAPNSTSNSTTGLRAFGPWPVIHASQIAVRYRSQFRVSFEKGTNKSKAAGVPPKKN